RPVRHAVPGPLGRVRLVGVDLRIDDWHGALLCAEGCGPSLSQRGPKRIVQLVTLAKPRGEFLQFGLFGSASARRGSGEFDSTEGYHDWIEYNVEAEALGFRSTFCVEHHFTGYGQVSATLNLLTWLGSRTKTLRLGTAVMVLPWHNPVLL